MVDTSTSLLVGGTGDILITSEVIIVLPAVLHLWGLLILVWESRLLRYITSANGITCLDLSFTCSDIINLYYHYISLPYSYLRG